MREYQKQFLKEARETKKTYKDMIEFCGDNIILNNYILPELAKNDIFFETYCGDEFQYFDEEWNEITRQEYEEKEENGEEVHEQQIEIYQYYIISERTAEMLSDYTNEIVLYNDEIDLYLLCVSHFGTAWNGVPANWKDPDQEPNEED